MQGFFSGAKTFELFSWNQTIKRQSSNFCWRNKAGRQMGRSLSSIYFLYAQKADASEKCREIPEGGGRGHDDF
jgi:hypothetical protein